MQFTVYSQDNMHWLVLRRGRMFADIAKQFLSDGDTLENSIVEFLQYKFYFIHADYSLKIHWARLRPLPQCERNLGYKYLGPNRARATEVGLR